MFFFVSELCGPVDIGESLVRHLTPHAFSAEPTGDVGGDDIDDDFPPSSQRGWILAPQADVGCQTAPLQQMDRQVGCDLPRRTVETRDQCISVGTTMTKKQHERAVKLMTQNKFILGLNPGHQVRARAEMTKFKYQRRPKTIATPTVSIAVADPSITTAPLTSTPLSTSS